MAQLAAQRLHAATVAGSIPAGSTIFRLVAQWSERATHNRLVAGSSPAEPTNEDVAERLGAGLQNLPPRFDSGRPLQFSVVAVAQ